MIDPTRKFFNIPSFCFYKCIRHCLRSQPVSWCKSPNLEYLNHLQLILQSTFCSNILLTKKIQSQTVSREKQSKTLLYKKCARKMLVKLTPCRQELKIGGGDEGFSDRVQVLLDFNLWAELHVLSTRSHVKVVDVKSFQLIEQKFSNTISISLTSRYIKVKVGHYHSIVYV